MCCPNGSAKFRDEKRKISRTPNATITCALSMHLISKCGLSKRASWIAVGMMIMVSVVLLSDMHRTPYCIKSSKHTYLLWIRCPQITNIMVLTASTDYGLLPDCRRKMCGQQSRLRSQCLFQMNERSGSHTGFGDNPWCPTLNRPQKPGSGISSGRPVGL